jgi:Na+-transporting NADH:ubiquinone oxidoreductase subunit NqrC
MNQKLVFVSIIAIVATFAVSTIAIGLGPQDAQASTNCKSKGLVSANVCGTQVCVNAQVITDFSQSNCKNNQ